MEKHFWARCIAAASIAVLLAQSEVHSEGGWKAGVATVNITPPQLMWMAGYSSRTRPAEGKLTDLWAKALVLEDDAGRRAMLITLDLVGIGRQLSQKICETLGDQKWKREQIVICMSHTHTGPVVGRNLLTLHFSQLPAEQQQRIEQYEQFLHDRVVEAATAAQKDLAPASLSSGQGTVGFAVNRRENPAGTVVSRRRTGTLRGPVDHDVPILAVRRGKQLRAVVFGYACHATVLNSYKWSGDYPGFAQIELQRRNPQCVAMFWAGCGGDQNPLPRRTVDLAKTYGGRLADAVQAVLASEMRPVAPRLNFKYREIDLAFSKLPDLKQWEKEAESADPFVAARAAIYLEQLKSGKPIKTSYPYPVATWQLGDIRWAFLGGEVVVDYALRIKSEQSGNTWVAAYANDVMAYVPSCRVLREGGYEGGDAMIYYGLPCPWSEDVERGVIGEVTRQFSGYD